MSRTKDKSEIEHVRALNRQLEKENKMLRRQVARLSKRSQDVEELEEALKEEQITQEHNYVDPTQCKNCLKGNVKSVSLGVKQLMSCDSCNYRKIT